MIVSHIISGGQTGPDRGGLDAAMQLGIAHGGHCPAGRLAEDGAVPAIYQLVETPDNDYRTRTRLNVENADVTLLFSHGGGMDGGTRFTREFCDRVGKPWAHIALGMLDLERNDARHARWLRTRLADLSARLGRSLVINVAGNRESKCPGIQERTKRIIYLALESRE